MIVYSQMIEDGEGSTMVKRRVTVLIIVPGAATDDAEYAEINMFAIAAACVSQDEDVSCMTSQE